MVIIQLFSAENEELLSITKEELQKTLLDPSIFNIYPFGNVNIKKK